LKAVNAATRGIAGQRLLHPHAQGGEEEAPVESLAVHDGQACVAVAVLGADGLELTEQGPHVLGLGVAAPEVLVEAARLGHRVEQGVGDESVDLPAHQQPLPAVDLRPLHGPLGHGRVDVAGVGVDRLVVVVVGVEGGVVDGGCRVRTGALAGLGGGDGHGVSSVG
jgi:hypothetical protein